MKEFIGCLICAIGFVMFLAPNFLMDYFYKRTGDVSKAFDISMSCLVVGLLLIFSGALLI